MWDSQTINVRIIVTNVSVNMYGEEDIMSQTQSQDELPLGQQSQATKIAAKEEQLQKAKKKFNDDLIVKNNQEHSDDSDARSS